MTIKIALRKDKKNVHGLCPLVIQISDNKNVSRIPLGYTLKEEDFDQETQTVLKKHSEYKNYNQFIQKAKAKIELVSNEVMKLEQQLFGFPKVSLFKELYNAEEGSYESILNNYEKEYGIESTVVEHATKISQSRIRYPINFRMPIAKYGEAMTLLRKLAKNEPDPKIDELLAGEDDENDEKKALFSSSWDKYYMHSVLEKRPSTSSRIPNLLIILKEFTELYKIPLTFDSFTEDFGLDFKHYLLNEHYNYVTQTKGVANGTVHNIQKSICAFLNWAFKKSLNTCIEYKKWNTKKPKTDLQYLTEPQLKKLRKFRLPKGGSLDKSRDLWLFSAYTGMRCGDVEKWLPSYVTGEGVIKYVSEKTKKPCAVGLNDISRSILKKYSGELPKQNAGLINRNIKVILRKMGYDKINVNRVISKGTEDITKVMPLCDAITMHSAKRSFINLMISKNVQIAHLSTMIGNDIKSLMVYYKNDTSQIKKVMDKIDFA